MSNDDTRARNNRRLTANDRHKVIVMDNFTEEYFLVWSLCPRGGGGKRALEICHASGTIPW